jgi:hypothetical protein
MPNEESLSTGGCLYLTITCPGTTLLSVCNGCETESDDAVDAFTIEELIGTTVDTNRLKVIMYNIFFIKFPNVSSIPHYRYIAPMNISNN